MSQFFGAQEGSPGMGRGVEGHSAWQGASRRPSQSRNWERVMCRGLAQHCWQLKPVDIWRKVPKQHSVWLYLPAEQTLADWNSHLGSHQLKQAWPRLSVDLLRAQVALLAQAWLWKAGPSSYPPDMKGPDSIPSHAIRELQHFFFFFSHCCQQVSFRIDTHSNS